jgi:superfamily II DNA or RNA helicase
MLKQFVITGKTGSGKTYHAIKLASNIGTRFVYLAPCRQLVSETAIKYGEPGDSVKTGEVRITGNGNLFAVYESQFESEDYDTLIIDEAHFINDVERGWRIRELIDSFHGNIFLVTATRNFGEIAGFTDIVLKPKIEFNKHRIERSTFFRRKAKGVSSVYFHRYKDLCGKYGGVVINADTPADVRLETQLAFANGDIRFIETTNVLAQGVNFPCENVLIERNAYDSDETVLQKLGRLGRFGITDPEHTLTYCTPYVPKKIRHKNILIYNKRLFDTAKERRCLQQSLIAEESKPIVEREIMWFDGQPDHICPHFSYYGEILEINTKYKYSIPALEGTLQRLEQVPISNRAEVEKLVSQYHSISHNIEQIIYREWSRKHPVIA